MFNYEYKPTTDAGRVCLELSLKPFGYDKSPEGIEKVCREYFGKWSALFKYASGCSVLLWTSDGSEILEFTGNLDDSFEWCKYIGIGNWDRSLKGEEAKKATSLHRLPIHYMENPPDMTYRDLKNIIEGLKRVGKEMTGLDVKVGETFDPGPEFAYSAFKYERHPEIAKGNIMGKMLEEIEAPRPDLSKYAPRAMTMNIDPDKVRIVIGPGGKTINKIIDETGVKIDIDDDGQVFIASPDMDSAKAALDQIELLTAEVEVGKTYTGEVKRIMNFGAFIEVLPGKEGLLHISKMAKRRVEKVEDVMNIGDKVEVTVYEIDNQGRINLKRPNLR